MNQSMKHIITCGFLISILLIQGCGNALCYLKGYWPESSIMEDKIGESFIQNPSVLRYIHQHQWLPIDKELKSIIRCGDMKFSVRCDQVFKSLDVLITFPFESDAERLLNDTNGKDLIIKSLLKAADDSGYSGRIRIVSSWNHYEGRIHNSKLDDSYGDRYGDRYGYITIYDKKMRSRYYTMKDSKTRAIIQLFL
jgi:hypothetical protein